MWLKDTEGNPSMTVTLTVIAFLAFIGKFLVGGVEAYGMKFAPMDSGVIAAYAAFVTPLLATYVARRNGWGQKDSPLPSDPALPVKDAEVKP